MQVSSHSCPNGWRAAVTLAKGMTQLNAESTPPADSDYRICTVLDADNIEFNDVTPVDANGREWPAWVSGGFLQWYAPASLTGVSVRMKIRDKVGGTVLASSEEADAPKNVLAFAVDDPGKAITLTISAVDTAGFAWVKGVYDIEAVDSAGKVTLLCSGKVSVSREVTT